MVNNFFFHISCTLTVTVLHNATVGMIIIIITSTTYYKVGTLTQFASA
jgi:hypothetical protein